MQVAEAYFTHFFVSSPWIADPLSSRKQTSRTYKARRPREVPRTLLWLALVGQWRTKRGRDDSVFGTFLVLMFVQQKAKPSGRTSIYCHCHWLISLGESREVSWAGTTESVLGFLIFNFEITIFGFFFFNLIIGFYFISLIHFFAFD